MPIVETLGLGKQFGEFRALSDCSLTVETGEVFGLLGPNGAGKTTFLRLLLGFMRPSEGRATVDGLDIVRDSVAVRRLVSYLPGEARLPRHMKSQHLLKFFNSLQPRGDFERSLQVADRLELDLRRRVAFMSTGMRQKLALAAVLGPRTPLLILDEPTANLDPSVRSEVLKLVIEARAEGRTVIFSSHVLSEIEDVCDRAVFLRRGKLVLTQRLDELRDRHLIRGCSSESLDANTLAEVDSDSDANVSVNQDSDGQFTIDAAGRLTPVLQWLLKYSVRDLRIEPVRLRTVYNTVHRGETLSDNQLAATSGASLEGME